MAKTKKSSASPMKCIGDYVCLKTLGEGTFGKVKLAIKRDTGQKVAIKIIKYSHSSLGNSAEREMELIRREQTLMKQLKHPNIVQILEVIEQKELQRTCLVMEYVKGGELFQYITDKSNCITEAVAARMLSQILDALEYMHTKMIVHRDIKPENILLDEHKNVKLTDFGLCNSMNLDTYMTSRCGSPLYAAPEILRGSNYIGPEVDVWSAGVILHVMLSASIPWHGNDNNEWTASAIQGTYIPLTNVTPECEHIISRMLTVNPRRRATIAELRSHPFMIKHGYESLPKPKVLTVAELDDDLVQKLENLGFERREILDDLVETRTISESYQLYHLLYKHKNESKSTQEAPKEVGKHKPLSSPSKKEVKEKEYALKKKLKLLKSKNGLQSFNTAQEANELKAAIAEMNKVKTRSLLQFIFRRHSN